MEKILKVHIERTLSERKIEYVLEKHLELSRTLIARLKRIDGAIMLNGQSARVIESVHSGDIVTVSIPGACTDGITATDIPIEILYEDEEILAVNKPCNMPVHPSGKNRGNTLSNGVKHYLGKEGEIHIITRLDRDTTGIVLMAKNVFSAKILTEEMKNGNIQKEYVAIVNGKMKNAKGVIDIPVKRDKGIKRIACSEGKSAVTEYESIQGSESMVRLFPKTGRTHQLRVHLSYIGHPIFGDVMYGAPQEGERCRLHCMKLAFTHPQTKERLEIIAPLPEDMKDLKG